MTTSAKLSEAWNEFHRLVASTVFGWLASSIPALNVFFASKDIFEFSLNDQNDRKKNKLCRIHGQHYTEASGLSIQEEYEKKKKGKKKGKK